MHIVHVEDFVHPDAGYQVNLLAKLQAEQGHRVTVVAAALEKMPAELTAFFGADDLDRRDANYTAATGVRIIRVPLLGYLSGRAVFHPKIFRIVDDLKPDVALVHGVDTLIAMQFVWRAGRLDYPILSDCHMLEMASKNRFRNYFRAFYKRFVAIRVRELRIPVIRVVDSDYVEKYLGIPLGQTELLSFGSDTKLFAPDQAARSAFRRKHGISEAAFVIVYAGKLDPQKGGEFLARAISERIAADGNREFVFVIVGNAVGEYGVKVEGLLAKSANRILRFPTQPYRALAGFYQAADIALFPRQCSLSFFDVQASGLPVLFEDNEVNRQRVGEHNAFLFAPEDVLSLRAKMQWAANMRQIDYDGCRKNARDYALKSYDYVPIAQQFTDLMSREVERFRRRDAGYSSTH
jgi:glycosyltransferase involved in cell wall biosynthesis